MLNEIVKRQNEEKSIAMLAAQRQLYKEAKKLNNLLIFISVLIPLILSIIEVIIPQNLDIGKKMTYFFSLISMFGSRFLENLIDEKKDLAAFIQQKFDVYVYNMPWDRIFGVDKNVDVEIAEYSEKIINNIQQKNSLKNWYTTEVGNKDDLDGILGCQRENFLWDVGLRKKFILKIKWAICLLSILILVIGLFENDLLALLGRFFFIAPLWNWLFSTLDKLKKDIASLEDLNKYINDNKAKTMDDLQLIQSKIYKHRQVCYTIPEFIYNKLRNNYEDKSHRTADM